MISFLLFGGEFVVLFLANKVKNKIIKIIYAKQKQKLICYCKNQSQLKFFQRIIEDYF